MRAVEGEGVPTTESSEMLAKGEGPMDAAEVVSGPHPEKLLEAKTPHGMASEKGNAVAEAGGDTALSGSEAAKAGGEAAEAGGEDAEAGGEDAEAKSITEAESAVTVTAPAPAAMEAEVEQTDVESKDVIPTE